MTWQMRFVNDFSRRNERPPRTPPKGKIAAATITVPLLTTTNIRSDSSDPASGHLFHLPTGRTSRALPPYLHGAFPESPHKLARMSRWPALRPPHLPGLNTPPLARPQLPLP
eukprot:3326090-Amphidinium_carterae.2